MKLTTFTGHNATVTHSVTINKHNTTYNVSINDELNGNGKGHVAGFDFNTKQIIVQQSSYDGFVVDFNDIDLYTINKGYDITNNESLWRGFSN